MMMIVMSGYLFMKGPASNLAQLLFRVGRLGAILGGSLDKIEENHCLYLERQNEI